MLVTRLGTDSDPAQWSVYYTLDSQFRVVGAESGDDYRGTHRRLEMLGQLDHRFSESHDAELLPVLSWDGQRFVETGPAFTSAGR